MLIIILSLTTDQTPDGNVELYEKLIQEVQRCECLYVPGHPQYKDKERHDAEWAMIGQVLGISGQFCM